MISVVIPAFNEQGYIVRCLESLKNQDYAGDFEVIVVDSQCTDGTVSIARKMGARVISQGERGIARARQCGFVAARGEIIASTDADTLLPEDWLSRIDCLFAREPQAVAVAGHFLLSDGPLPVRFWLKVSLLLMPFITWLIPGLWNFSGTNFAVRASVFNRLGGFNTELEFGEDVDLCRRLRQEGKVVFEPGLLVRTSGRSFRGDWLGFKHLFGYLGISVLRKNKAS